MGGGGDFRGYCGNLELDTLYVVLDTPVAG